MIQQEEFFWQNLQICIVYWKRAGLGNYYIDVFMMSANKEVYKNVQGRLWDGVAYQPD